VGTVRRECVDRRLIVSRRHLEAVVHEFVEHYNSHRPHRSLGQLPPQPKGDAPAESKNVDASRLQRTNRLGGLIHEYRLVARRGSRSWHPEAPGRVVAMVWKRHAKALASRPESVALSALELLEPKRQECLTRILTLSELAEAVKANRRRRTRGSPDKLPTARSQPSALELLEPNRQDCLTRILTLSELAEAVKANRRRRTRGSPDKLPTCGCRESHLGP
jgi:hypothetical protein